MSISTQKKEDILYAKFLALEPKIRNYIEKSYYDGYNLNYFFTEDEQGMMFDRLLSCDKNFKKDWKNGMYSVPEDPNHKMYFSTYIKKQSSVKKFSRTMQKYSHNNKLTKGAKNLLEMYMREYAQKYINIDADDNSGVPNYKIEKMNNIIYKIFCGIYETIRIKKIDILEQKVPRDAAELIFSFVPKGGSKRKKIKKSKKRNITVKNAKSAYRKTV
jgi:hypothetical protein